MARQLKGKDKTKVGVRNDAGKDSKKQKQGRRKQKRKMDNMGESSRAGEEDER